LAGLIFTTWLLAGHIFKASESPAISHGVENIGRQLLNYGQYGYVFPFEVISILLLAALIGSIVIAMKSKKTQGEGQ
jgi:NADH-quinone oxidoreductase subunit J